MDFDAQDFVAFWLAVIWMTIVIVMGSILIIPYKIFSHCGRIMKWVIKHEQRAERLPPWDDMDAGRDSFLERERREQLKREQQVPRIDWKREGF
jgi:hypothetical protein